MRLSLCILLTMAIVAIGLTQAAHAEDASGAAIYVVTYVEAMPPSTEEGIALLRQYCGASRKDAGNIRCEVLQQHGRLNHFVLLETWKDSESFETHGTAAHTAQFHTQLQALRNSPNDERVHQGLSVDAMAAGPAGAAVYVVTHVDVIPARKDDGVALLKQLADDSRKDEGNVRYEVLQQTTLPNHFSVVEMWMNQQAFEAHGVAAHTRQFRTRLQPISGSPYDERLYRVFD